MLKTLPLPLVLLLWSMAAIPAFAQFPGNIDTTSTILPAVVATPHPDTQNLILLSFDFSGSAFSDPPTPIDSAQNQDPRWVPFIDFGDGIYTLEPDSVYHIYNRVGTFRVSAKLLGIYTPDRPPPMISKEIDINGRDTFRINSNFNPDDTPGNIKLQPHMNALMPGDTLTAAISYAGDGGAPGDNESNRGTIYLRLGDHLELIEDEITRQPSSRTEENILGSTYSKWNFILPRNQEETLFFNFRVGPELELDSNSNAIITDAEASIDYTDLSDEEDGDFGDLIGFDLENASGINDLFVPLGDQEAFSIRFARDPNITIIDPMVIPPGKGRHRLRFRTYFENNGSSFARSIRVRSFLDPAFQIQDVSRASSFHPSDRIDTTLQVDLAGNMLELHLEGGNGNRFVLPSTQQAETLEFDLDAARGFVEYHLYTRDDIDFQMGDSIKGHSLVLMDQDSLYTNTAYVLIQEEKRFGLPWYAGIRAGLNFPDVEGISLGGWHAEVFLRKALGKLPASEFRYRRLSINRLPKFWYTPGIGYSNIQFDENNADFNLHYLQLTPASFLWVPVLPASWMRNISANRRLLGIGAGYELDVFLSGSRENSDISVNQFSERLDHMFFGELRLLNMLGTPGLSVGLRGNYRISNLPVRDEDYFMLQFSLYYNFKKPLRRIFSR